MERTGAKFFDQELQKQFDDSGFVKLSLLNKEQVEILYHGYQAFKAHHEKINIDFISTSHSNDKDLIEAVDNLILKTVEPEIMKHVYDSKVLFSNFLVKWAGPDSETPPHQDASLVDETKFISFSVWVALV